VLRLLGIHVDGAIIAPSLSRCEIQWKEGKDVTQTTIKKKQKNKKTGQVFYQMTSWLRNRPAFFVGSGAPCFLVRIGYTSHSISIVGAFCRLVGQGDGSKTKPANSFFAM
jgi:hypothetical protein